MPSPLPNHPDRGPGLHSVRSMQWRGVEVRGKGSVVRGRVRVCVGANRSYRWNVRGRLLYQPHTTLLGGGRNFGLQHEGGLTPIEGGGGVVGGGRVLYTPRLDIHKNPCLVIITIKNQVV